MPGMARAARSSTGPMSNRPYSFDDHPEHRALLPEWTRRSVAAALNCAPMVDAERDRMRAAAASLPGNSRMRGPTRPKFR